MAELIGSKMGRFTLFSQSKNRSQSDLLAILSSVVMARHRISSLEAKIYIRRCLPQTQLDEDIPITTATKINNSKGTAQDNLSLNQIY